MRATVLIVDDHASFRQVARMLLAEAGFEVVGEAEDGASALAKARALRPDVVLLDVQLPDADGFAVSAALAEEEVPPLVVLTSSRDESHFEPLLRASRARGFIAKEKLSRESLANLVG